MDYLDLLPKDVFRQTASKLNQLDLIEIIDDDRLNEKFWQEKLNRDYPNTNLPNITSFRDKYKYKMSNDGQVYHETRQREGIEEMENRLKDLDKSIERLENDSYSLNMEISDILMRYRMEKGQITNKKQNEAIVKGTTLNYVEVTDNIWNYRYKKGRFDESRFLENHPKFDVPLLPGLIIGFKDGLIYCHPYGPYFVNKQDLINIYGEEINKILK